MKKKKSALLKTSSQITKQTKLVSIVAVVAVVATVLSMGFGTNYLAQAFGTEPAKVQGYAAIIRTVSVSVIIGLLGLSVVSPVVMGALLITSLSSVYNLVKDEI